MRSPHNKLEMAMMQLQKELDDCHTEFEITRRLTTTVDLLAPRQARFTFLDTPGSRIGNGGFVKVIIRPLQLSGTSGGIQAAVSAGGPTPER